MPRALPNKALQRTALRAAAERQVVELSALTRAARIGGHGEPSRRSSSLRRKVAEGGRRWARFENGCSWSWICWGCRRLPRNRRWGAVACSWRTSKSRPSKWASERFASFSCTSSGIERLAPRPRTRQIRHGVCSGSTTMPIFTLSIHNRLRPGVTSSLPSPASTS